METASTLVLDLGLRYLLNLIVYLYTFKYYCKVLVCSYLTYVLIHSRIEDTSVFSYNLYNIIAFTIYSNI